MKGEASLLTESKRKKRPNSRFLYVPRIVVRDVTFLRRKDAEEWGIDIERRIDRQEPTTTRQSRDVQLFGDLISLHRQDLKEVGKDIGRSKTASGAFLRWDQGAKQWSVPFVSLGVEDGKVVVELPTRPCPPVLF
jgi:hypothetical protein